MPSHGDDDAGRTDRPDRAADAATLPTVREIVALDAVAAGVPEVLVGGDALEARVRWVHVSDSAGVARLLVGGELLLSTGSGWPDEPAHLDDFVGALVEAGAAGLVLELGTHHVNAPDAVVRAARERGLALIALTREVRFVTLTEAVHRRIISEQLDALHARDEVRERFTSLALRGAPADYVVRHLAHTLGGPVVLENLAREVVVAEVPGGAEAEVLDGWGARSRAAHRGELEWSVVPVEARGIRWGHVVALPGPAHPAGRRAVLEQGAIALALSRLADGADDSWARISRRRLVEALLTGRFATSDDLVARVEAAGVPVRGAQLIGLAIAGRPRPVAADAAARALGGRALEGSAPGAASARLVLLSLPHTARFDDDAVRGFAAALADGEPSGPAVVVAVGTPADDLDGLARSAREAVDLVRTPPPRSTQGIVVRRAADRPIVALVTSLRDDHRLQQHGERMLAPILEYDAARGGDLLDVLAAMLAHPGNRTAAARASHLSRSVFYQRLALIGELLGADLDDGETLTALHIALLVHRGR